MVLVKVRHFFGFSHGFNLIFHFYHEKKAAARFFIVLQPL